MGILAVDLHFPGCGSLKDKRQQLRSLKANLARRLGASVAETGFHDLWQRSCIVIAISSGDVSELERSLDMAERFIESKDIQLAGTNREIIRIGDEE
ncbi:MAG: DUF503 domain-containing protein [Thermoleophilia bacterium]